MRQRIVIYAVIFVIVIATVLGRCGGPGPKPRKMAVDSTSPMGPAPDNNSANNPSLADTAYERDRTKPITDTVKKRRGR